MSTPRRNYKKKKKEHSIVPVLFTLGIIGWGFFAIDRLTAPLRTEREITLNNYSDERPKKEGDSWRKRLSRWIQEREEETPERPVTAKNVIPVVPDESLGLRINRSLQEPESLPENPETAAPAQVRHPLMYFYSDAANHILELKKFEAAESYSLKEVFTKLILGPLSALNREDLIDSFPVKPAVLDVQIQGNVLVLNLDENFGMGVSFETLKLQINQLWLTSRQFQGVESLQILINGQSRETVGSDGYNIPRLINESSWLLASAS